MISNFINKLIFGSADFCHICLNKCDDLTVDLQDKYLQTEEFPDDLQYEDLFCSVLGEETAVKLSCLRSVCTSCAEEALRCYKFILKSKQNIENIFKSIESLNNSINKLTVNKELRTLIMYKSVFIELASNKHFYDTKVYNDSKVDAIMGLVNAKKQSKRNNEEFNHRKSPQSNQFSDTQCHNCLKNFCNKEALQNHRNFCMKELKVYQCTECTAVFETEDLLQDHNITYHCKIICLTCGKLFQSREALKQHQPSHKQLMCHNCGRVYKSSGTYRKHINSICSQPSRAPASQGTFICDYCKKRYTQKMSLRVHMQYEHLNYKAHECNICQKKFWAQSRLKSHMVKHTKEKRFQCTSCGGKFVTKESLLYHTRMHTGEKPYECQDCGEQFISASRRQVHFRKVHLKEKFPCDDCNIMFPSKYKLRKHMQSKHF